MSGSTPWALIRHKKDSWWKQHQPIIRHGDTFYVRIARRRKYLIIKFWTRDFSRS